MNRVIEEYYAQTKLIPYLLEQKFEKLNRNKDICDEFEYWIINKKYKNNALVINGYSAEMLAEKSKFIDGEGAFMLLIELRENPEKALKQIKEGFVLK